MNIKKDTLKENNKDFFSTQIYFNVLSFFSIRNAPTTSNHCPESFVKNRLNNS